MLNWFLVNLLSETIFSRDRVYYVTKGGMIAIAPVLLTDFILLFNPFIDIVALLLNPIAVKSNYPPLYELCKVVKVGTDIITENSEVQIAHPILL